MPTESNSFETILKALMDDFGGPEIFSEENASRLKKVFEKETGYEALSLACIMGLPQKLYAVKCENREDQKKKVDDCYTSLLNVGLHRDVCLELMHAFTDVMKLPSLEIELPKKILDCYSCGKNDYDTCQIGNLIWLASNFVIGGKELCSYSEAENRAPRGWRLPTIYDYQEMLAAIRNATDRDGSALKSIDSWNLGLDLFGFNAVPTHEDDAGLPSTFFWLKDSCYSYSSPHLCFGLEENSDLVAFTSCDKSDKLCVRYVKDIE